MAMKAALKVVIRGFAAPVQWAMTAWDWLGPAYRVTVPVICYLAFLRHRHPELGAAVAAPDPGSPDVIAGSG